MTIVRSNCLGLCAGLLILFSCSQAQGPVPGKGKLLKDQKVLIVYLSKTNNTKAVAEIIHKKVGGDLVALEMATPYRDHYQTAVAQVGTGE